jgi:hypothetical protein
MSWLAPTASCFFLTAQGTQGFVVAADGKLYAWECLSSCPLSLSQILTPFRSAEDWAQVFCSSQVARNTSEHSYYISRMLIHFTVYCRICNTETLPHTHKHKYGSTMEVPERPLGFLLRLYHHHSSQEPHISTWEAPKLEPFSSLTQNRWHFL